MKKNRSEVWTALKWSGFVALGALLGVGGAKLTFDTVDAYYARKSDGLPLLMDGVHLTEGEHKVVVTDQFYNVLSYEKDEVKGLVISAFKEAYNTLNENSSRVKFNLCTTNEEVAEKYFLPKIDAESIEQGDIRLFARNGVLCNNNQVMANTDWDYTDLFTREMKDLSITFRSKYFQSLWDICDTIEETLAPKNSALYTVTIHETMHAMGFAHVDDEKSIMNTYLKISSPRDITEYDKQILDKYNVVFYGAEPIYQENETSSATTSVASNISNKQNEEEMSF